ncbi:MAG: hypothetical protein RI894_1263 [Bacteroidota bacterium]|jgi:hypothetical protein
MKSKTILLALLFCAFWAKAQVYYYHSSQSNYSYSEQYINSHSTSRNLSVDNAVDQTFGYLGRLIDEKKEKEAAQAKKEKMQKRVAEMRKYYESLSKYPQKMLDGWHEGVLLGSDEYIADAKFLVKNNKVTEMVWDDWLPQELNFSGPILKCKTGIRIKDGKGPLEGIIDVMFINFIADSTSTAKPALKPGKVTFWTNNKNIKKIGLQFEDFSLGHFTHYFPYASPPKCGADSEIVVYFKPGLYTYKATILSDWGYSNYKTLCEGKVRITEEGCEIIQINKESDLKR